MNAAVHFAVFEIIFTSDCVDSVISSSLEFSYGIKHSYRNPFLVLIFELLYAV